MTKKLALTMAAGLALALLVGVAAITLTFGGASVANAGRDRKPIVKHQVQTVTVHRKAGDSSSSGGVRVVHLSSGSASGTSETSAGFSDDDGFESETGDDGEAFSGSPGSTSAGSFGDD
jgi:hypothetical protein